jgi:heptosyltransferase III
MKDTSGIKNILVTRTDRLGDVILTLPLIHQIKKKLPDSKIFFLIKKYVQDLLLNYEDIDELVIEEEHSKPTEKFQFIREKNIDMMINVKPEFELAFTGYAAGVKHRIGSGYRWYSFFYNHKVREHRKYCERHEYEYNLNLWKTVFDDVKCEKIFKFKYTVEERNLLEKKLIPTGVSLDKKYIIIHPGSGGSSKDIPIETWKNFVKLSLMEFPDYQILFTGTGYEGLLISEIMNFINGENIINLSDKLSLKELLILIDKSDLFFSNSTGPVHIAGALNKNIIAFYPNLKPNNDVRWKPLSENAVVMKPAGRSDKMNLISAENILIETKKFLV